jgi:hypothetical protein
MAVSGEATMAGVPAAGLPKMISFVFGMRSPAFVASPLWSTRANAVRPLSSRIVVIRAAVSATG